MTYKPFSRPEVHAHRGTPLSLPENALPGFRAAIEAGADYIELDLQCSKDRKLVISHDPHLPSGELIFNLESRDCNCPLFEEVVTLNAGLNIEVKSYPNHPEYGPGSTELARLVADALPAGRVLIQSFDFGVLRAMRPGIPLSALWEGEPRDYLDIAREAGAQSVSIHYPLLEAEQVGLAHAAGVRVLVWTVNGAEAWGRAIAAGVDGIITDDAAGLIDFLRIGLFRGERADER